MSLLAYLIFAVAAGSLVFVVSGIAATYLHLHAKRPAVPASWPSVSLLKPLKGVEEELEENLRAFFVQDYAGELEVVFATTETDDPAIEVAKRVAAEFPSIPVTFVISDPTFGLNPKVSNLHGALMKARFDLVLQSDANVRVPANYLSRVVSEFVAANASLLSSIVVGTGERSVGAMMENLQLSAFIAPATCVAVKFAKITCVIGKSMLLRRSELIAFGGLDRFKDYLAEDFLLGEAYQAANKVVVLSPTPVWNVNVYAPAQRFFSRHSRWLKMRIVIHVGGFVGDLFGNPVSLAFFGLLAGCFAPLAWKFFGAVVLVKMICDAIVMRLTRGSAMPLWLAWVAPVKDLCMGGIWFYSMFSRSVVWRGTKLRVGPRSHLRPHLGRLPARVYRRMRAKLR